MQITREELEAQGVFIPSEVNDELIARFRVGSPILIEIFVPMYDSEILCWQSFIVKHRNNGYIFKSNTIYRFASESKLYSELPLTVEHALPISLETFKNMLKCLKKNC